MHLTVDTGKFRKVLIVTGALLGVGVFVYAVAHFFPTRMYEVFIFLGTTLGIVLYSLYRNRKSQLQLQKYQEEVSESQSKFLWLYRNSPIPYITIDLKNCITLTNLAALRLFGVTEDELLKTDFTKLLESEKENTLSLVLGRLQSYTTVSEEEMQVKVSNGEVRWVLLSVFLYSNTQERLVSLVDITTQKQIEIAKTEFVSLASHQLRTPVTAIRWDLELLGATHVGELNEAQLVHYEKIERNVKRMILLIDDFLSVSKLELGTFATDTIEISLRDFCNEIIAEFQEHIEHKHLKIITSYTPDDLTMKIDQRLMHIVVSNIISNAVKYTPLEGEVSIQYEQRGSTVQCTISDTGMGIPTDDMGKLFTKFFRATNARAQVMEGTGLGLYIVQQSATLMGGTISVTSEENKGTTFIVTLPL